MRTTLALAAAGLGLLLAASPGHAQQAAAPSGGSQFLHVFFDSGSASVRTADFATLDKASRTYREGQPIVMVLTGSTDSQGNPLANLELSQRRAQAVLRALVARGIPAERFQILAKGQTEPAVPSTSGQPEPQDRSVEIAWR